MKLTQLVMNPFKASYYAMGQNECVHYNIELHMIHQEVIIK